MFTNIKAAIFDLDGTLVDSMWIWSKIDIDYLKKRNISVPEDLKNHIEHLSFIETAKYFKDRFNLTDDVDVIMNEWTDMAYEEYSANVKLKPGAKQFLLLLKSMGLKIALATSNTETLLQTALKNNGIYDYFDVVCRTDEVERGKNFPDIYLYTAEKLGVSPEHCMVFEDILPAVMGAKAAGMKVVAVHDEYSADQKEEMLVHADEYILRYEDIS